MTIVSEARREATVAAACVGLLVLSNVASNRVLPEAAYVPWNLAVAAALVVLARRVVTRTEMGLANWRRGLWFGLVLAAATIAVLLVGALVSWSKGLYADRRVHGGLDTALYHTLVRIPLGTVVLEEVAFRGVLPALGARRWGAVRACIAASALFGLWHILPAMGLNTRSPVTTDLFGRGDRAVVLAVASAVAGTFFAGLWWCFIRYRARSVLATVIGHIATNSGAYAIAVLLR